MTTSERGDNNVLSIGIWQLPNGLLQAVGSINDDKIEALTTASTREMVDWIDDALRQAGLLREDEDVELIR